jgi:hypothetical protein
MYIRRSGAPAGNERVTKDQSEISDLQSAMVEPLSQREPDVLRLFGTDLSGPDIAGPPGELSRALLMGAGWLINLAIAEWAIRKRQARPVHMATSAVPQMHRANLKKTHAVLYHL